MSFSFSVLANSKDEAKAEVVAKVMEIIGSQPAHDHDREAIVSATNAYIDLVDSLDGETISVSVSGSVGWVDGAEGERRFNGAGVSISVRSYQAS